MTDTIGLFPQTALAGVSSLVILFSIAKMILVVLVDESSTTVAQNPVRSNGYELYEMAERDDVT